MILMLTDHFQSIDLQKSFNATIQFVPNLGLGIMKSSCNVQFLECALNRHVSTIDKVKEEVAAWQNHRNNKDSKINWRFTTKESRIKLRRLYPSIDG